MNKKILIVDDDEAILEAIKVTVEMAEYEAVALSRGEETVRVAREAKPDLILLDLLLSGVDGVEIVQRLRGEEITKDIPIVMLSAHPTAAKVAFNAGANGFIAKPFDINDLLKEVGRQIK